MDTAVERLEHLIHEIRGHKVILDSDLAHLYGVPTKRLNEQVKRNRTRFPSDFMFRLTRDEFQATRNWSQFATGSQKHCDPRLLPFAFTEHVAIMAANVLNSPRAVQMSIHYSQGSSTNNQIPSTKEAPSIKRQTGLEFRNWNLFWIWCLDIEPMSRAYRAPTAFERRVYAVVSRIPNGQTRSYRWVAQQLGNPWLARAVGGALNRNPDAPRVPCHRVIRTDGTLGGYRWGLAKKRRLLTQEDQLKRS